MPVLKFYDDLTSRLRASGDYLWPLALRLILASEFLEAGLSKLHGENWFAQIPWEDWQKGFPVPFGLIPTDLNWFLATWSELAFAVMECITNPYLNAEVIRLDGGIRMPPK